MDEATRLVSRAFSRGLKTDSVQTIDEWAEENRVLTSESSAEPGPWRNERTPYLVEPMRYLSTTSSVEIVVLMFGSQLGKSELGNNFLGYIMHKAPAPIIMVQPTVDMAKDYGRTRIDKMIASVPALAGKVSEAKSRDSANTLTMKEFPGGYLFMTGSNSPATLSSKPIRYSFQDEVDRFAGNVGGEGDPCSLVFARQRTFSRRKSLITSTPTISGHSRIEQFWERSNKHEFYVPCPVCGHYQVLKLKDRATGEFRLQWEEGSPETAHYVCEAGGCRIENHEKTWMLEHGEWRADNPEYKGNAIGFHLSSLYSPVGWFSWAEIAAMYEEAKKNTELMKVFVNTVLGEPYTEEGESLDWELLYERRESTWSQGTVPFGGLFLTAGADVQLDRIEVEVVAWGRNFETWSVDYRVFPGVTSDLNSPAWRMLDNLMSEQFQHESGLMLPIACLAIDTGGTRAENGHSTTQITYAWCKRYPAGRVMPVKGSGTQSVMIAQPRAVDVMINGKKRPKSLKLWSVGVDIIKSELFGWLRLETSGDEPLPVGYAHFPEDRGEEWFKQLTAEYLEIKKVNGRSFVEWVKLRPRNEALDCRVYARAAAALMQIDNLTDAAWSRLESAHSAAAPARSATPAGTPAPQAQAPKVQARGRRMSSKGLRG